MMGIYISASMSANRKGRFLQNVVEAEPLKEDWRQIPPAKGLLLVQGEELSQFEDWKRLYSWSIQSGCAALVIAPLACNADSWSKQPLSLDWQLVAVEKIVATEGLAALVSDEISLCLSGMEGGADGIQHQVNGVVHTRFMRKHSNSGLLAVTTLPVWSLNLLDHGDVLLMWLNWFIAHAGEVKTEARDIVAFEPDKQDLLVLLLVFAVRGKPIQAIIDNPVVRMLFDTAMLDMNLRWPMLQQKGFIGDHGLTEKGLDVLMNSNYWIYSGILTEQLNTGAL
ncbi:TPA: hypothetical protein JDH36_000745 [Salmonella enterica subsp. indica]|nr:hypothetical protein [Salmonella enterica]HAE8194410.1 hypothetical protein [Salmonella enterica subsp. indica serovar 41:b:1,7]HAU3217202.1 hypothetical protein [Salmonella enterica subsp. indica]